MCVPATNTMRCGLHLNALRYFTLAAGLRAECAIVPCIAARSSAALVAVSLCCCKPWSYMVCAAGSALGLPLPAASCMLRWALATGLLMAMALEKKE
jgi:hypothetical protein